MVKQRLIDGDELYGIESLLNTDIIQNSPEASWLMAQVLYDIQASPTIDTETLPIVRQLRAELARVTEERNLAIHAVKKLIQEDSNPCVFCSKAGILCSGMNPDFCESFEWRGPQKEAHP